MNLYHQILEKQRSEMFYILKKSPLVFSNMPTQSQASYYVASWSPSARCPSSGFDGLGFVAQILQQKKICLWPVSRCRCSSHNLTGLTAASLYLPNDIVRSRRHCLGLRRRLRFARGSLRAVRFMRNFVAVLSKFIERTAMCSRGAGQYGRACLLTCPADLLARCPRNVFASERQTHDTLTHTHAYVGDGEASAVASAWGAHFFVCAGLFKKMSVFLIGFLVRYASILWHICNARHFVFAALLVSISRVR